jgi:aminoglycoside 3-N-acetyltransferase
MNADELARELRTLGLQAGTTVLAHASLRALGRVDGGAKAVIGALRHVLGPAGTLVVATTTAANSDSSRNHLATIDGMTLSEVRAYRATMPPYDRAVTPAETGQIAEEIRTNPDAIRSAHPQSSFAAIGPLASALMRDHRIGCHLGEDSPLGKLYALGAWILLLGVEYQSCSALHLAEYRYKSEPPRQKYRCVVKYRGKPQWRSYSDVVLDDTDFTAIGVTLDKEIVRHHGLVGQAECRLLPLKETVDHAAEWMHWHRP